MPIGSDNTAERAARIEGLLVQIAEQKQRLLEQRIALWTLTDKVHRALQKAEVAPPANKLN